MLWESAGLGVDVQDGGVEEPAGWMVDAEDESVGVPEYSGRRVEAILDEVTHRSLDRVNAAHLLVVSRHLTTDAGLELNQPGAVAERGLIAVVGGGVA